MNTSEKYLLFIIQDANFQSRSLLVPYNKFLQIRQEDYQILLKHSRAIKFVDNSKKSYDIPNVLFQMIGWNGNYGKNIQEEWSDPINKLRMISDWGINDGIGYKSKDDELWLSKSYSEFCRGFNHVKNYDDCSKMTDIEGNNIQIVDGFLVLEKDNTKT